MTGIWTICASIMRMVVLFYKNVKNCKPICWDIFKNVGSIKYAMQNDDAFELVCGFCHIAQEGVNM